MKRLLAVVLLVTACGATNDAPVASQMIERVSLGTQAVTEGLGVRIWKWRYNLPTACDVVARLEVWTKGGLAPTATFPHFTGVKAGENTFTFAMKAPADGPGREAYFEFSNVTGGSTTPQASHSGESKPMSVAFEHFLSAGTRGIKQVWQDGVVAAAPDIGVRDVPLAMNEDLSILVLAWGGNPEITFDGQRAAKESERVYVLSLRLTPRK